MLRDVWTAKHEERTVQDGGTGSRSSLGITSRDMHILTNRVQSKMFDGLFSNSLIIHQVF